MSVSKFPPSHGKPGSSSTTTTSDQQPASGTGLLLTSPTRSSKFSKAADEEMSVASTEVVVDLDKWKVDFTELPPRRLVCTVCSRVFRNPHVTVCPCKKTYCLSCVEAKRGRPCSSCDEEKLEVERDSATQQSINELYVRCLHVNIGCMWFGKLEFLLKHLDMEGKGGGCVFVTIPCPNNCGGKFTKKSIKEHQLARCVKRQYSCEFCGDYSGTYESAESDHFPQCPQYPVLCPNRCPQKKIPRSKLDFHLKNQCEHQDNVSCVMEFAGCQEKLLRKNMHTHIQKNLVDHMLLIGKTFASQKQSIDDMVGSLPSVMAPIVTQAAVQSNGPYKEDPSTSEAKVSDQEYEKLVQTLQSKDSEIRQMKVELRDLQKQLEDQNNSMMTIIDGLRQSLKLQEQRLAAAEEHDQNFTKDISRLQLFLPSPLPLSYTVGKFDQLKTSGKWWYSRPFYSHYCGYKFGMFVFCNGVLDGKDSHISIFLYLVRGEYDEELEWPFRGSITIQLLNQRGDRGHHQKVIRFTDDTPPSVSSRVVNSEMAKEGNGPTQFISHADLSYNPEKDTEYVRDDSIKLRVSSISIKGHGHINTASRGTDTLPRKVSSTANRRLPMDKSFSIDSQKDLPPSPSFQSTNTGNKAQPISPTSAKPTSPGSRTSPTILVNGSNGNGVDEAIKEEKPGESSVQNGHQSPEVKDEVNKIIKEKPNEKPNEDAEKTVTIDL